MLTARCLLFTARHSGNTSRVMSHENPLNVCKVLVLETLICSGKSTASGGIDLSAKVFAIHHLFDAF